MAIMFIKIFSELRMPCSPEQICAKIIMSRDQNIPKGTAGFGQLRGSFCCFKAVSGQACTASSAALLEAEGSISDSGPYGSGNHPALEISIKLQNAFVQQR